MKTKRKKISIFIYHAFFIQLTFFFCIKTIEAQKFNWNKLYLEGGGYHDPGIDGWQLNSFHYNLSLGYQFRPLTGIGLSNGHYHLYARTPSFYAIPIALEYRIIAKRYFAKAGFGHLLHLGLTDPGGGCKAFNSPQKGFHPHFQWKAGIYFLRYFAIGITGVHSSNVNVKIEDHCYGWGNDKSYLEPFRFSTIQPFIGLGIPGYKKKKPN